MTSEATGIALSVADRVRDWSRQERDLAIMLRSFHAGVTPLKPSIPASREVASLPTFGPLTDVRSDSPIQQQSQEWEGWTDTSTNHHSTPIDTSVTLAATTPSGLSGWSTGGLEPLDHSRDIIENAHDATSETRVEPAGPFDEFIAAVTDTSPASPASIAPLPPPSRFMVRVAQVGQPHRTTKRNYDYFEELNARLARQSANHQKHNSC